MLKFFACGASFYFALFALKSNCSWFFPKISLIWNPEKPKREECCVSTRDSRGRLPPTPKMKDYQKTSNLAVARCSFCGLMLTNFLLFKGSLTFLTPKSFACGAKITKQEAVFRFVPQLLNFFVASFSHWALERKLRPVLQRLSGHFSEKILENVDVNVDQITLLGTKLPFQVSTTRVFYLRGGLYFWC